MKLATKFNDNNYIYNCKYISTINSMDSYYCYDIESNETYIPYSLDKTDSLKIDCKILNKEGNIFINYNTIIHAYENDTGKFQLYGDRNSSISIKYDSEKGLLPISFIYKKI
jgi:hypothetical protein